MDFDADLTTVDTGVWRDFDGSSFLIAHMSTIRFQRSLSRYQQPHRRKIESGTLDPQVSKEITCKAMAEGVLLDWRGVGSKKSGESDVPYSVEAGYKALMGNAEFRDFVSFTAMDLANFRQDEVEELGKSL